jgi:hypothetical protein
MRSSGDSSICKEGDRITVLDYVVWYKEGVSTDSTGYLTVRPISLLLESEAISRQRTSTSHLYSMYRQNFSLAVVKVAVLCGGARTLRVRSRFLFLCNMVLLDAVVCSSSARMYRKIIVLLFVL